MANQKPIKRESFVKGDSVCVFIKEESSFIKKAKLKGFFSKRILGDRRFDCTVLLNGQGFNIPFHIENDEKIIRTRCLLLEKHFPEY
jgi:hypothetical protein